MLRGHRPTFCLGPSCRCVANWRGVAVVYWEFRKEDPLPVAEVGESVGGVAFYRGGWGLLEYHIDLVKLFECPCEIATDVDLKDPGTNLFFAERFSDVVFEGTSTTLERFLNASQSGSRRRSLEV